MQAKKSVKVGSRESILARLQTDLAIKLLYDKFPDCKFEVVTIKTSGDKILNKALPELGGQGVFVKELEEALIDKRVDFVVHSLKDLPTILPQQLCLIATPERADARDVLVSKNNLNFEELPASSRLATSSRRRQAQLSALRCDLNFVDIRGNIQTRLRKLDDGECDAMVLAAAGLERLDLQNRISRYFSVEESTPAAGQGALALECRQDDENIKSMLSLINDPEVFACTNAERAFLNRVGGGCSVPAGAYARLDKDKLILNACITSLDGKQIYKDEIEGASSAGADLGVSLAEELLARGAAEIIEKLIAAQSGAISPP